MSALIPVEITPYLPLVGPPVVGAFIGYLTNRVAIRMLFRPLVAWRVFGLRVPMTPGVIPAKRSELARNMGAVVGEHLLTGQEVIGGLNRQEFHEHLTQIIDQGVSKILEKELGPVGDLIPEKFKLYFNLGTQAVKAKIKKEIRSAISSHAFRQRLAGFVGDKVDDLLALELRQIAPADLAEVVERLIGDKVGNYLEGEGFAQLLTDFALGQGEKLTREKATLGDMLPLETQDKLLNELKAQAEPLLAQLAALVAEEEVRRKIVQSACQGVDGFISSMGPMSEMVRNFLPPGTVEAKISDYMEKKGEGLFRWLLDGAVQSKLEKVLVNRGKDLLQSPISELFCKEPGDLKRLANTFGLAASKAIAESAVSRQLARTLGQHIRKKVFEDNLQVSEVLAPLGGELWITELKNQIVTGILKAVRNPAVFAITDAMVDDLMKGLLVKPLGRLSAFVPPLVKKSMVNWLQQVALKMLANEIPGLVKSLDIQKIVTKKIDSLDLLKLESLLLSIMEQQFKYINLFGALLGFLIGCLNVMLLALA